MVISGTTILEYLTKCGLIKRSNIVVLKGRKTREDGGVDSVGSTFYADCRDLHNNPQLHEEFLRRVGASFGEYAKSLGVQMLIGVVKTGVTLAKYASEASGIPYCTINPHDPDPQPGEDIMGRGVMLIDDVLTSGASLREVIPPIQCAGGDVVGVGVLVKRNLEVDVRSLGLSPENAELVSLLEIDFPIEVEALNENSSLLAAWLNPKNPIKMHLNEGYAGADGFTPENYPNLPASKFIGPWNGKTR